MQPKSKKTYFTLKISVLIMLILVHFGTRDNTVFDQLTQLLQQYHFDDKLIEIGNTLSTFI